MKRFGLIMRSLQRVNISGADFAIIVQLVKKALYLQYV